MTSRQLLRVKRMAAVRKDYLSGGVTSQLELAERYGLSSATISIYVREILKQIREEDQSTASDQKALMERRLLAVLSSSKDSYERSKKNAIETSTVYNTVKCKQCKGTGFEPSEDEDDESEEWCLTCEGEGTVVVEVVTQRVKGQAGDSSHLTNMLNAIKEWNKLHGNYPEKPAKVEVDNRQVHIHQGGPDLSNASAEDLLSALSAISRLKESSKGETIDAE